MKSSSIPSNYKSSASAMSEDALLDLVKKSVNESAKAYRMLIQNAKRMSLHNINWSSCRALCILGDGIQESSASLGSAKSEDYAYINADGSCVILVKAKQPEIYVRQCGCRLKTLALFNTCLLGLDLSFVNQLTTLILSDCRGMKRLYGLDGLEKLTLLEIYKCRELTHLRGLGNLLQLRTLNLQMCDRLEYLSGLENLTSLTVLNLSHCSSLRKLPDLTYLNQMTSINLSHCIGLEELPSGIQNMEDLRQLELCDMKLKHIPDWLPDIAEKYSLDIETLAVGNDDAVISMSGTTVNDLRDMDIFERPHEVVSDWINNQNMVPLNEIKVVFLGDGEVGKTYTIGRLMNDGNMPDASILDNQTTPGIVIRNKEYKNNGRKFRIHFWDFGGQEITHSMHRIFLTDRTMYVVLINARGDSQGDRARYWLQNIQSFAPNAPVLLVLNKIDQNINASVDETSLRNSYPNLTCAVHLSALNYTPKEFSEKFTKILLKEIQKTGFLDAEWPVSWIRVKKKLENMSCAYIKGDMYQTICAECGVNQDRKELLRQFNDLGTSFCYDGEDDYNLDEYVILRPDWITNALYIILFNPLEGASNGRIPHKSIFNVLKNACRNPEIRCTLPNTMYRNDDIQFVLGVMRKFSLSFACGNDTEFIPMLCKQDATVEVKDLQNNPNILEFRMEFDYLPNNLIHRLMVERQAELDMKNVWRTGARFRLEDTGLSAVVAIDSNDLRILIRSDNKLHRPNTYLTMLKANVERIVETMGLKPPVCSLIYKLNGKQEEFDYDMLKEMQEAGEAEVFSRSVRRRIPIADILNQSAPDIPEVEIEFLKKLQRGCQRIQAERCYRLVKNEEGDGYKNGKDMEDFRNRRIRDTLQDMGEYVYDQTQQGSSSRGEGPGELDIQIRDKENNPWTIVEALRVNDGTKAPWNQHLDKLIGNYNVSGLPRLYLLTYVDADSGKFQQIWKGYQDHIKTYNPGKHTCRADTFVELKLDSSCQYIKIARCEYDCGGERTTLYHIFARIPTQNE